jgi:hypothetical protein
MWSGWIFDHRCNGSCVCIVQAVYTVRVQLLEIYNEQVSLDSP